jgi:hypothetical protein
MRLAVEHVRRLRGGSQSHLMRCEDGEYYVVKFQNNPQHLRTLANDMLATRLAMRMGICVPQVDVVEVPPSLIKSTSDLVMQLAHGHVPCASGKQFGSKFPTHPSRSAVSDLIPNENFYQIDNVKDFLGILVFDKWTCNTDNRQVIFVKLPRIGSRGDFSNSYQVMMIDQGFCFNGGSWNFPDGPIRSLYANRCVYSKVETMESFDPWLCCLENEITLDDLNEEIEQLPPEWLGESGFEFTAMIKRLYARRGRVRELLWSTRNAARDAFPNWNTYSYSNRISKGVVQVTCP